MTYCYAHDSGCGCEPGPEPAFPDPIYCGGCGRIIREVEEGVWVRAGSDECEAGGVHLPPAPPVKELAEFYLMRSTEGKGWWAGYGWSPSVIQAQMFSPQISKTATSGEGWEWVGFCEIPF